VHEVADRLVIIDRGRVVRNIKKGELSLSELTNQMIALHEDRADALA
jgi:simple sugar transport system ATP-binding protein